MPQVRIFVPRKGGGTGKVMPSVAAEGFTGGACSLATAAYASRMSSQNEATPTADIEEATPQYEAESEDGQ